MLKEMPNPRKSFETLKEIFKNVKNCWKKNVREKC